MADTIKNSYVPFNGDGTADRIDQSLQDDLNTEWYRREKLAPKGESIPVVYGSMTLEGISFIYKSYKYSKRRGSRFRGRWREQRERVVSGQVFCYGGQYSVSGVGWPSGTKERNIYNGTQTSPPKIIFANRNNSNFGPYGWSAQSIGKGLVYGEFYGDHKQGQFTNEPITATVTRADVANNHADVIRDYLTNSDYGVGWDSSLIDSNSFGSARTYLTSKDPVTDETFLNCNYTLDTSESFKKNLETLLSECRGALIESNGKIKLIIERPVNPVIEINESNITGTVQTESIDSSKRFNRVIAKYFDQNAKAASMVVYPDEAKHKEYLAEDNGVINQGELSLKTVTDVKQAFTQARIMCELSRGGESLTVTVHGEATLLEVFDVVTVNYPDLDLVKDSNGKFPEYIVEEVQPDLEKQTAKIKLRYYDSSIYPIQDGRTEPPSPPRVPELPNNGTITFSSISEKDNNKVFIRWDYDGDFAPSFNVCIYKDSVADENVEYVTSTTVEQVTTPPLIGGNYIIEITARDRLGFELVTSDFSFSTDRPVAPLALATTSTYNSITIEPKIADGQDAQNTEFVYYLGVTDVEANAKNYGSGDIKQITGLKADTTHHIWVYTKTPFGTSSAPAYTTKKTEKIPNEIGGSRFENRYKLAPPDSPPATPTGDNPTGWFTSPQDGALSNWVSTAEKNPDGTLVTGASWSKPVLFDAAGQFTWVAYADDPIGNGISTDSTGKNWIGYSYNKEVETVDINDPSVFEWNVYLDGEPLKSVHVGDNSITTPKLKANAVTAGKIQAGAVETDKLAADCVTTNKLNTTALDLRGANMHIRMAQNAGDTPVFEVDASGKMKAQNAEVEGVIKATTGEISGSMTVGTGVIDGDNSDPSNKFIKAGNDDFYVTHNGFLYAKNGKFEGEVEADKINGDVVSCITKSHAPLTRTVRDPSSSWTSAGTFDSVTINTGRNRDRVLQISLDIGCIVEPTITTRAASEVRVRAVASWGATQDSRSVISLCPSGTSREENYRQVTIAIPVSANETGTVTITGQYRKLDSDDQDCTTIIRAPATSNLWTAYLLPQGGDLS